MYDINKYNRNPDIIKKQLKSMDNKTICESDLFVLFPNRFFKKNMASIKQFVNLAGYFVIMDKKYNYSIVNSPIILQLAPSEINSNINIDGVMYTELIFKKGDKLFTANEVVENKDLLYLILDEFFIKGNVPWYMNYEDLTNVISSSKKYCGSNIGTDTIVLEMLASILARDRKDKNKQYKDTLKDTKNLDKNRPSYIGLNNIYHSFDDTGSRLLGSYFNKGITASINNPETKTSNISKAYRE